MGPLVRWSVVIKLETVKTLLCDCACAWMLICYEEKMQELVYVFGCCTRTIVSKSVCLIATCTVMVVVTFMQMCLFRLNHK